MSSGHVRGKNDKLDAIRIAEYAYKNRDTIVLHIPKRPVVEQLNHLCSLRDRMNVIGRTLKTRISEQTDFITKDTHIKTSNLCLRSKEAIENDITAIESQIKFLIDNDENLTRLFRIITSVDNIGPVTAIQIIISTNEFLSSSCPKKFACYCGVAPFEQNSGKTKFKARVSNFANKKIKSLLHLCALSAVRKDVELMAYYERKTVNEGKPKMAVINAVRNKLILRVFACVKQNRKYSVKKPSILMPNLIDEKIASELSRN
jgi:transposase